MAAGCCLGKPGPPTASSSSRNDQEVTEPHRIHAHPVWVYPRSDVRFRRAAKRLFARIPLTQRAIRWLNRFDLRSHDQHTAVIHHRHFSAAQLAAARSVEEMNRFASHPRQ